MVVYHHIHGCRLLVHLLSISGADTSAPSFTAPTVSSDTSLKFSLTVKDDKGNMSNNPAIVTVTVKPAVANTASSKIPNATTSKNSTAALGNQAKVNATIEYTFVRKWGSKGIEMDNWRIIRAIWYRC